MKANLLANLTWEEVRKVLRKKNGLIIPSGICEQHSTHLPLNTDTLLAEYISRYLSARTGLLVAPTLNYGVGLPCDSVYAGTSSVRYEDLRNTLRETIRWWKKQGFKRFFVVSAHGDPFHIKALRAAVHGCGQVLELYDINMSGILEKQAGAKHACEAETSVMLHLFPGAVRKKNIIDFETPFEKFKPYLFHKNLGPIAGSPGGQGYPSFATAKKGGQIVRRMKNRSLDWIDER